MRETNAKVLGKRSNAPLKISATTESCVSAGMPTVHGIMYFGMRSRAKHLPRVDEHGRALVRAVLQKSYNPGIIEILVPNVITDLYSEVPGAHAPAQFFAGRINIL